MNTQTATIPQDWQFKTLAELDGQITSGSRAWASYYVDHGSLFVRITNLDRSNIHLNLSSARFVQIDPNDAEARRTRLETGDLLVSITADIGIIGYINDQVPKPAYVNQHIARVRLNPRLVDSRFVAYYLASWEPQRRFVGSTDTGAKAGMNLAAVAALSTVVPPLTEQSRIADALADVDNHIATLERKVTKKQSIKQGMMQQLLTGSTRLPGFSGEWVDMTLAQACHILDNLRVPLSAAQRVGRRGPYPYCGANGVLDHINDFMIDDDVILLAEDGGNFDQFQTRPIAYRMSGKIWVNNHAHVLKGNSNTDTGFLFYALEHKDITPYISSGTRSKLTRGELVRVKVAMPQETAEQQAIAKALSDADAEITALRGRLSKAWYLKRGMMQQLLTGRTRLPVKESPA